MVLRPYHFNDSDVCRIQSEMPEHILKINISEPILVANFNKLERFILGPFNYCSSEYHFNNWLIENKLLFSIQQITINNQMCLVNHGGEIH